VNIKRLTLCCLLAALGPFASAGEEQCPCPIVPRPKEYRDSVLPPEVTARVGVEMGVKLGWEKYIGIGGQFIGMCGFGASAPAGVLLKHFGFTVENVVAAAKQLRSR